jgi:aerobic-type carbon monoxide dehydrogenase small subunit (CoxS/CutS family)
VGTRIIRLNVNGRTHEVPVKPQWTLSQVLRNNLGLTGTKEGCGKGACGSCTVIVDGRAVPSCMMLAIEQEGKPILTIEGLAPGGKLNPIQEAWIEEYGAQCGFCSSGMIMSSRALLDQDPKPTEQEIREALAGNICICSNYEHIVNAVKSAADKIERSRKHA